MEPLEFFRILRVCYSKSLNTVSANTSVDTATNSCSGNNTTVTDPSATKSTCSTRRMSLASDISSSRDGEVPSSSGFNYKTSPQSSSSSTAIVCYETFTPELVRDLNEEITSGSGNVTSNYERLETMRETFSKVMAFLRNTGLTSLHYSMSHTGVLSDSIHHP